MVKKQRLASQYSAIINTIVSSTIYEWESMRKQMMISRHICTVFMSLSKPVTDLRSSSSNDNIPRDKNI